MARDCRILSLPLLAAALVLVAIPTGAHAQATFKVAQPVTLKGRPSKPDVFTTGGIRYECSVDAFSGTLRGNSKELKLVTQYGEPIFSGCVAKLLGGLRTKFAELGCFYVLHGGARVGRNRWRANVDIGCRYDYDNMVWYLYENKTKFGLGQTLCTVDVLQQKGLGTAELSNVEGSPGAIAIHWDLTGIEYKAYGSSLLCGPLEAIRRDASYTGDTILTAKDLRGRPTEIVVSS